MIAETVCRATKAARSVLVYQHVWFAIKVSPCGNRTVWSAVRKDILQ
jgi:hypothetical protein